MALRRIRAGRCANGVTMLAIGMRQLHREAISFRCCFVLRPTCHQISWSMQL